MKTVEELWLDSLDYSSVTRIKPSEEAAQEANFRLATMYNPAGICEVIFVESEWHGVCIIQACGCTQSDVVTPEYRTEPSVYPITHMGPASQYTQFDT